MPACRNSCACGTWAGSCSRFRTSFARARWLTSWARRRRSSARSTHLARGDDGRWRGDIFDGLGCVEAFRRRGLAFSGKRVMLLGAGGAGSAIAAAIAFERPASLRIFDIDSERARLLAETVARANPRVAVAAASPTTRDVDILVNASPVGMLDDARLPLPIPHLPRELVVFDAIVKPERTPLITLAEQFGCTTVYGREMMRGQIARMVDFFYAV